MMASTSGSPATVVDDSTPSKSSVAVETETLDDRSDAEILARDRVCVCGVVCDDGFDKRFSSDSCRRFYTE